MKTDVIRKTRFTHANRLILVWDPHCGTRKESRLPDCLSYSVVKEPTSAEGRQDCQTPPSVSSGMFSSARTHSVWLGLLVCPAAEGHCAQPGDVECRCRRAACQPFLLGFLLRLPRVAATLTRLRSQLPSAPRYFQLRAVSVAPLLPAFQRSEYRFGATHNGDPLISIPAISAAF